MIAALLAGSMALGGLYLWRGSLLQTLTSSGGAEVTRAVSYGSGSRRTLDVYVPRGAKDAPVVVFFYGGSWQSGDKEFYGFVGNALAARGFVTIIPDYRVYPEVVFPGFLEDAAHAVRWARDNASRLGGDRRRIVLFGHSAGAHIASMLALDGRWLRDAGLDTGSDIAGLIGLSGPYDFLPLTGEKLIKIFGGRDRAETQPINFVTPQAPTAFFASGDADTVVSPRNSEMLAAKLTSAGVDAKIAIYAKRGHIGTILAFATPFNSLAPVAYDVADFIRSTPARNIQ